MIVTDDSSAGEATQVEVATFRSDIGYSDGRHPDRVIYATTPQEDVKRRDFTINALLLDPETQRYSRLCRGARRPQRPNYSRHWPRGRSLSRRQAAHGSRRAVRQQRAQLASRIEAATFTAILKLAPEIHQVSPERLRDELTKLLTEGAARRGFELLDETRLLHELLPEISRMKGVEQPPQFHPEGDVWVHTLLMLAGLPAGCSATLAWGVLLHDVGKPPTFMPPSGPNGRIRFDRHVEVGTRMAEEICRRFRFSNDDTTQIAALVANHLKFKDVPQMKPATLKRFVRLDRFDEHLALHRLDCISSHGHIDNYEFVVRFLAETPPEQVRPPRLLTGDDLIELGLLPGRRSTQSVAGGREAQLNGKVSTREEAIRLVRASFPRNCSCARQPRCHFSSY